MYDYNNREFIALFIILILIVSLAVINFAGIEIGFLTWLERSLYNILSPVLKIFTGFYNSVVNFGEYWQEKEQLIEERNELKKEVAELEREKQQMENIKRENKRLRELLAFKDFVDYKTEGAKVIGHGPSTLQNKIIINKGRNEGIEEKMPVISYNGILVGRVESAGNSSARIQMINDPDFVVAGIVQREESRAAGIVKGTNDDVSIMEKIGWDEDIVEEDLILTSGLSDSYPRGIPIGRVIKVEEDNYGVSQKAEISLFIDSRTIEEVLVITDF
ncbi:MAG: rod shape-determining protein MreC [Halanaerobiales bacterium]